MPHTPGPWEVVECRERGLLVEHSHDNGPITTIAKVLGTGCDDQTTVATANADARLIAAAPDLLAALEWFENRAFKGMSEQTAAKTAWAFVDICRAALAKAKGE